MITDRINLLSIIYQLSSIPKLILKLSNLHRLHLIDPVPTTYARVPRQVRIVCGRLKLINTLVVTPKFRGPTFNRHVGADGFDTLRKTATFNNNVSST
jgi:hypothetical protein